MAYFWTIVVTAQKTTSPRRSGGWMFRTDTYIDSKHIAAIPGGWVFLEVDDEKDLAHLEINLREWARQVRVEMDKLGIAPIPS